MPGVHSPTPTVLEKVPPFPPVAARLLGALAHPDVEIREVAKLIASDATFTAHLLRRINSYEFGLASPVSNVQQAVAIAGLDLTRQITATQAATVYTRNAIRTEELRRCWQHSIATAVLAEQIATACETFTSAAFTAGIMHDLGRLGLMVAYPDRYERVIRDAAAQCLDLLDFEREEFGLHHAEAGRFLSERWGLPEELQIVAGRHHDASEGLELDLLRIVHIACRLADALGYDVTRPLSPSSVPKVLSELPMHARNRFRKTAKELQTLIDQQILALDAAQPGMPPPVSQEVLEPEDIDTPQEPEPTPDIPEALLAPPSNREERPSLVLTVVWTLAIISALATLLVWKMH
jgi:HD-like signal output (HDOD) protein